MFGWNAKTERLPRRSLEASGAYDGGLATMTHGFIAGTRVASNLGWRDVSALSVGDLVLTFDNGMQPITELRRTMMWVDAPESAAAHWPVTVPAGALDNRVELTLLADQGVLVESDAASDMYGDPFAIVPAVALVGYRGITRRAPQQQIEVLCISFAEEQVIYAEGGTLLHCPKNTQALDVFLSHEDAAYDVLGTNDAILLAECMAIEDYEADASGWVDGQMAVAV